MADIFRDAPIGQLIRFFTKNSLLKYPEEKEGFAYASEYYSNINEKETGTPSTSNVSNLLEDSTIVPSDARTIDTQKSEEDDSSIETAPHSLKAKLTMSRIMSRPNIIDRSYTMMDVEEAFKAAVDLENICQQPCRRIKPEVDANGYTIVDWYTTTDDENPQNWSSKKKGFVTLQL
jgi:DHA1 family multidrug resistance protein-like MFS transporter